MSRGSTVDQWKRDLEIKHGMPADEIPGHVYILCFDEPRAVHSVSTDYPIDGTGPKGFRSSPIRHYVGWTQQRNPRERIYAHGPGSAAAIVELERGTMADERRAKRERVCPECGGPLTPGQ